MENTASTKKEARERGLAFYHTGKPCKNGHLEPRRISSGKCLGCERDASSRWREANPDHFKQKYHADPEHYRHRAREYYQQNAEKVKAYSRAYYASDSKSINKRRRAQKQGYLRATLGHRREVRRRYRMTEAGRAANNAYNSRRRSDKRSATPSWADHSAILEVYALAHRVQAASGVRIHVDHYYPIRGATVCGLHVKENLRVITAEENEAKNDKHPEDWEREKLERGLYYPSSEDLLE